MCGTNLPGRGLVRSGTQCRSTNRQPGTAPTQQQPGTAPANQAAQVPSGRSSTCTRGMCRLSNAELAMGASGFQNPARGLLVVVVGIFQRQGMFKVEFKCQEVRLGGLECSPAPRSALVWFSYDSLHQPRATEATCKPTKTFTSKQFKILKDR